MIKPLILLMCLSLHSLVLKAEKTIVFMGPPGSGKGTQALRLSEKISWQSFSIGNIIRAEQSNSSLSQALSTYEEDAQVNDLLKIGLMLKHITEHSKSGGIILDAWPKGGNNLAVVNRWLFQNDAPLVIELMVSKEDLIKRAEQRIVCPNAVCGKSYGLGATPPENGICDKCNTHLNKRKKDVGEDFVERINKYVDRREFIFQEYENLGINIIVLDGTKNPEEIHHTIMGLVQNYLSGLGG